MKEIKNVEGEYFSTYAFVSRNKLEDIADMVLGEGWVAEDDVAQIQGIIDCMNIGKYSVTCSEYDSREDDIVVRKIEDPSSNIEQLVERFIDAMMETDEVLITDDHLYLFRKTFEEIIDGL